MHWCCMCADFGFAKPMFEGDELRVMRGSPLYMAPEIICQTAYDARVDLWSIGVILYGNNTLWTLSWEMFCNTC